MIYFAQAEWGGPVKIGYCGTGQETNRLRMIQTHNPTPMRLTRVIKGDRADERALHQRFADLRIRGEWFYPAPELAALATAISAEQMETDVLTAAEAITAGRA